MSSSSRKRRRRTSRRPLRGPAAGLAAGLAAAALAACGEDTGPFTATDVTKPQYILRGDEICAEGERELRKAATRIGRAPGDSEVERVVRDTVIPVIAERIDRLRALEPPAGDEQEVDRIFDAAEQALERVEADPALAEQADQVFGGTSRLANAYGFDSCAGA